MVLSSIETIDLKALSSNSVSLFGVDCLCYCVMHYLIMIKSCSCLEECIAPLLSPDNYNLIACRQRAQTLVDKKVNLCPNMYNILVSVQMCTTVEPLLHTPLGLCSVKCPD